MPPQDVDALAGAMAKMCDSGEDRIMMGQAGQNRADKFFRHENMIDKYRAIYAEVKEYP